MEAASDNSKREEILVQVGGRLPYKAQLFRNSPLSVIRVELKMDASDLFIHGGCPMKNVEDEPFTHLEEILVDNTVYISATKKPKEAIRKSTGFSGLMSFPGFGFSRNYLGDSKSSDPPEKTSLMQGRPVNSVQATIQTRAFIPAAPIPKSQSPQPRGIPSALEALISKAAPVTQKSADSGPKRFRYPHKVPRFDPQCPTAEVVPPDKLTGAKYLVVLGETGVGKSRFLDCLTNYLQGVRRDHDFRLQLIPEESADDETTSQTQSTTTYVIESLIGTPPLVVIDTRGYADTKGTAEDEKTDGQLANLFQNRTTQIDLICFVMKSTETRLGDQKKYVISNVLKFFGNDAQDNFRFLFTFADTDDVPPALKVLTSKQSIVAPTIEKFQQANKDYYFRFNNSAVYQKVKDELTQKNFWKTYQSNMKKFVDAVFSVTKKMSMEGTVKTIQTRLKLNLELQALRSKSEQATTEGTNIQETMKAVLQLHSQMETTGEEVVEVTEVQAIQRPVEQGKCTTYCTVCRTTCHVICFLLPGASKEHCVAMKSNHCFVCKGQCHHEVHINTTFIVEHKEVKVMKSKKNIKDALSSIKAEVATKEEMLATLLDKYDQIHAEYLKIQEEILNTTKELCKWAMNPYCFESMSGYLEQVIKTEQDNKNPGWEKRLEFVKESKKRIDFAVEAMNDRAAWSNQTVHQVIKKLVEQKKYSNKGVLEKWLARNTQDSCETMD